MSEPSEQRPKKKRGCWYSAFFILVVVAIGSYYAVGAIWEAANRMQCNKQLKLIGLAMHNYHQMYGCFPPAYIADAKGRPLHSWRVLILPFLELDELYKKIRLDEPWDSVHNREVFEKESTPPFFNYFHCPSAGNPKDETCYVMIVGPDTISDGLHSVRCADIKDGASQTIMIAELKDSGIHWAEPSDLDFQKMSFRINDPNGRGVSSYHSRLANVVFADCAVHVIEDGIDPKLLKALITIDGGEDVRKFMEQ